MTLFKSLRVLMIVLSLWVDLIGRNIKRSGVWVNEAACQMGRYVSWRGRKGVRYMLFGGVWELQIYFRPRNVWNLWNLLLPSELLKISLLMLHVKKVTLLRTNEGALLLQRNTWGDVSVCDVCVYGGQAFLLSLTLADSHRKYMCKVLCTLMQKA